VLLKRRLAVLVATASLVVMMLLAMAPVAMASNAGGFHPATPPAGAPGVVFRNPIANDHDTSQHIFT
jgi:hypothetical protein